MMKTAVSTPIVKRLVLLGGGHSHLSVLMHLARKPLDGLEIVLITRDVHTPYSGALPGFIAGIYDHDDIHIDLRPLAHMAGAVLIQEEISNLDLENKRVICAKRPPIRFDILSLNIGSLPDATKIPGATEFAIGVKPMDVFLARWDEVKNSAVQALKRGESYSIAIVGGGPASVELAFSSQHAINWAAGIKKHTSSRLQIKIITADSQLMKFHNKRVKDFTRRELESRAVELYFDHRVEAFQANTIICEGLQSISADTIFYATGASIPQWPAQSGLATNDQGFIAVNTFLQTLSHPYVFACGDAASTEGHPRPKSGVYAVRQGMPLAKNIIRFATGKKLKPFVPQKNALALIYTGDRKAIASKNKRFFKGRWVWAWKHKIDMDFMKKYRELPPVKSTLKLASGLVDKETEETLKQHAIRCAGCGAKVGSSILNNVISNLDTVKHDDIVVSGSVIEDASLIKISAKRTLVQTVDYFRAFINDPWLFARIATNHCLGDIYAMGAQPHSALAIASVPFAAQKIMHETLSELMAGCVDVLNEHDTALAGGHSNEALELGFGLNVNGFARPDQLLSKSGLMVGDELILCKPLGTGTLLAADMRLKAKGRWMLAAFDQMLISSREAAECFRQHQANACTDITGFGLAGHLLEMINPDNAAVELNLGSLPVMDGVLDCISQKIFSSLHSDNSLAMNSIYNTEAFRKQPRFELLFDPQTAGGLLGSVPAEQVQSCLQTLKANGYAQACSIGRVVDNNGSNAQIALI
ncbi:MAG: selenide, water dikinase SelD [Gammaproteobacteria bacterium]|nr:selenide, water dikinase SelD [Gammaproteobacteria bacterium]